MTRQKMLLSALIGLLVVTVGYKVGRTMFYDPVVNDQKKVALLDSKLAELKRAKQVDQVVVRTAWLELAGKTLSLNDDETKNILTEQLTRLTEVNGLGSARIRPSKAKVERKTGVAVLPVSVNGQGTLKNVTGFLGAVYELPFLVRVRDVSIKPITARNSTSVNLTVKLETLVMPRNQENKQFLPKEIATFDLGGDADKLPRREPIVLAKAVDAYGAMEDRKPFHGIRPPPPTPVRPTVSRGGRPIRPTKRNQTPPAPPDPRTYTTVSSMLKWPGNLQVALTNNQTKQRRFFALGDELILYDAKSKGFNEGTIVLIHAYGVVTETDDGTRKLFSFGKLMTQPQPVTEFTDPTILAALAALGGK